MNQTWARRWALKRQFFFNSSRDTLSAQLGLGSKLVDWHRDATSVPNGHFWLNCWHEQTIDYLTVKTLDPIPHFFHRPVETYKVLGQTTHKKSLSYKCSNGFPADAKDFSLSLAQYNLSGFSAIADQFSQRKTCNAWKDLTWQNYKTKFECPPYKGHQKNKEEIFWHPRKGCTLRKILVQLSPNIFLDMEQFIFVPASLYSKSLNTKAVTEQQNSKISKFRTSHVTNWFFER